MMNEVKGFSEIKQIDEYVSVGIMREDSIIQYIVVEPMLNDEERELIEVAEVIYEEGKIGLHDVFRYRPDTDEFEKVGKSLILDELIKERKYSEEEFARRRTILEYMYRSEKSSWNDIISIVNRYNINLRETYLIALFGEVE